LTLRYWYTADAGKEQALDCVAAQLGCTNLITSADAIPGPGPKFVPVMPPVPLATPLANLYAEIAFKAGALSLPPLLDTGDIQLSIHNHDFSTIRQDDDWSYDLADCKVMNGTAVDWSHITAYLDGVLVWGSEPPLVLPPDSP
jgi:cellulose 1,4-beta-cellobiosidase